MTNTFRILKDGSKQPLFTVSGTLEPGTSDYDKLLNRPITNISAQQIVLSTLSSGVYKINGSWSLIEGSEVTDSKNDDVFFVENTESAHKVTVLNANGISNFEVPIGGTVLDIISDSVAMESDFAQQITESAWGAF